MKILPVKLNAPVGIIPGQNPNDVVISLELFNFNMSGKAIMACIGDLFLVPCVFLDQYWMMGQEEYHFE